MKKIFRNIETWFWQGVANRIIEVGSQIDDDKMFQIIHNNGLLIDTFCVNKGIYLN